MTKPEISGIAPLFIVNNVPAALAFYRDRLGFDITFQGPEPDDIFFGIVRRGAAMIMFKDVGVDPVPNYTRDVKKGIARWDAYLHVPDPDALAAEFSSRNVEFSEPLKDTDDGLRGFELKDADGYVLFFGRPRSWDLSRSWRGTEPIQRACDLTRQFRQEMPRSAALRCRRVTDRVSPEGRHCVTNCQTLAGVKTRSRSNTLPMASSRL